MPWQEQSSGYTTKRGGHVRNVPQYEALRDKGMSKERAAAITNAHQKKRGPKRDDDGGASTILVKAYQPGTITQHQEQAKIHRRKARQGGKFTEYAGGAALAAGTVHAAVPEPAVRKITKPVAYAGAAGALGGLGYSAFHAHRGSQHTDAAQSARKQRNAELAKDATTRDAAAAFLAGGSATHGAYAVQQHRRARTQRAESGRLHEQSQDTLRVAENRVQRHAGTGKGSLPRRTQDLRTTSDAFSTGRAQEHRAGASARNAITASRKAKGRAGLAVGLAAAAAGVERGRSRSPRYNPVGYR